MLVLLTSRAPICTAGTAESIGEVLRTCPRVSRPCSPSGTLNGWRPESRREEPPVTRTPCPKCNDFSAGKAGTHTERGTCKNEEAVYTAVFIVSLKGTTRGAGSSFTFLDVQVGVKKEVVAGTLEVPPQYYLVS